MAEAFNFELVSPERLLLSIKASEVVVPGSEGYLTVLARHAPMMTTIVPGTVTVKAADGKSDVYVVFGGFADITADGCAVLAEAAVHIDDISSEDINARIIKARELVAEARTHETRTKAEDFLHQLTTLAGVIAPA